MPVSLAAQTMRNFRTARLGGKDAAAQKGGDKGDGATGSGKEREEIDEVMRKVGWLRRMLLIVSHAYQQPRSSIGAQGGQRPHQLSVSPGKKLIIWVWFA